MARHVVRISAERVGAEIVSRNRALREALVPASLTASYQTLPRLVATSPVDQGYYRNGWEVVGGHGNVLSELRNQAPHAGIIELGTRPFFPPLAPLIEWVKRKFGDLTGQQSFRGAASLTAAEDAAAIRIARAVQQKIGQRGLRAHHVLRNQLGFLRRQFRLSLNARLRDIASRPGGPGGGSGGAR